MYKMKMKSIQRRKRDMSLVLSDGFVSTNDIICNWLFRYGVSKLGGVAFTADMRGRVPELNKNMAGNYTLTCPIDMEEVKREIDFRDRWTKTMRTDLVADKMKGCNWTSNWMTAYQQVELPGYDHVVHLPVFREKEFIFKVMGIPICPECVAIPFKMDKNRVGLLLAVYSDTMTEEYLERSRWLEGKLRMK